MGSHGGHLRVGLDLPPFIPQPPLPPPPPTHANGEELKVRVRIRKKACYKSGVMSLIRMSCISDSGID